MEDEEITVECAEDARTKVPHADRSTIGSLAGQVDLSGDWDSSATNAEIADDFA